MRTLNIQMTDAEYRKLGFEKQTLSLKELLKILSKSAFQANSTAQSLQKSDTPIVDSILGSVPLPQDFNYKEQLRRALAEKYL